MRLEGWNAIVSGGAAMFPRAEFSISTRAIALEFRDRGIRRDAVRPGSIRKDLRPHGLLEPLGSGVDGAEGDMIEPRGGIRESKGCAGASLCPADPESGFVNGATPFADDAMPVGTRGPVSAKEQPAEEVRQ